MNENIYKSMSHVGIANLAIGICILLGGAAAGILLIVSGAKLIRDKMKITF